MVVGVEKHARDCHGQRNIFGAGDGCDVSLLLLDSHEVVVAFLDDVLRDSSHAVDGDFEGITTGLGIRHPRR